MGIPKSISAGMNSITLEPIGYIATPFKSKAEAPHQPDAAAGVEGIIRLIEGRNFEQALEDLEGMEKIWLIYWFNRNPNWKPKVLVPRGPRQKRGVFATRSPYRPNPIGLSLVDLVLVKGLELRVSNVDLLDGTPILDIKPYLPSVEAYPDATAGWIEEADAASESPKYQVVYSDKAKEQLQFLDGQGIHLTARIKRVLSHDPSPHPYKRIEREGDRLVQAIRGWRVMFRVVEDLRVIVEEIRSGYSEDKFENGEVLADDAAQRLFHQNYSS
jgi:tRNA-Thr(GGU) m(6)t(6)A37 methyltransferase TsaA